MLKRLLIRYEWLILMGLIISVTSILSVLGYAHIDSNVFWTLAGLVVVGEGIIALYYERKEDRVTFTEELENEGAEVLAQRMNEDPLRGVVTLSHGSVGLTTSFHAFRGVILAAAKDDSEDMGNDGE